MENQGISFRVFRVLGLKIQNYLSFPSRIFVIPAKAGIQSIMDPRLKHSGMTWLSGRLKMA